MQNTPVNYWCLDARLIFNMGSSVMYVCKKPKKKGYTDSVCTDSVCTDSLDLSTFEVFNISIDIAVIHE